MQGLNLKSNMSTKNKTSEIVPTETKFNLKLGEKIYTLSFGTTTFLRIKESNPTLSTPFHVLDEMAVFEALPLLINAAIKPEEREWNNQEDLFDLYDECTDPNISKVIPAYISAAGAVSKKLAPALEAIAAMQKSEGK